MKSSGIIGGLTHSTTLLCTVYSELTEARYPECLVSSSDMTRVRNARLVQLPKRNPLEL
jgi:hypothetical protein